MVFDPKGHFSKARLGDFDGGALEYVTPAMILSSDYPVTIGGDGALCYVPFKKDGPREHIRRTPAGPAPGHGG